MPGAALLRRWSAAVAGRWFERRVPREHPRIRLHRRRLFILPTPLGYTYALTLALLLVGSLNYGTSLGFALTFLLAGTGAIAMLHTYRNLEGIELAFAPPAPVFAGEPVRLPIRITVPPPQRWSVMLEGGEGPAPLLAPAPGRPEASAFVFATQNRGAFRPPRLRVQTTWPFGLLRVWSWVWPDVEAVVYPACVDHGRSMPRSPVGTDGERLHNDEEDFAGLRDYRPGDSPRRIAWAVLARRDEVAVKAFEAVAGGDDRFAWSALEGMPPEDRLQQLCFWVVQAEAGGRRYGLELPDVSIEPDRGPDHRSRCLETLAFHGRARAGAA